MENIKKKRVGLSRQQNRLIFYCIMLIWPVIQVGIFYFAVNFNAIILAFQTMVPKVGAIGYDVAFDPTFATFKTAWNELIVGHLTFFINGIKFYAVDFPASLLLALSFSFYIYKKYPGAGLFKTMLFMPTIVSGLVFCILFKYISSYGYQEIVCLLKGVEVTPTNRLIYGGMGLLNEADTAFPTLMFYNIWISFGSNILLYSGAMSGIDESVIESAQLDGTNLFQEVWHITLPLIFPTIISLVIVSLTGIFSNNLGLVSLYGDNVPKEVANEVTTIGYKMYIYTKTIGDLNDQQWVKFTASELSAYGLLVSAVLIPMVLGVRHVMKKFGPSVD